MTFAPIVVFAYNGPDHLQRTIDALRAAHGAQNSRLWIFCDCAKGPNDIEKVTEVRKIAHAISGFSQVTVIERHKNYGLAASVCEGVTKLCEEYGRVIVVEDDLLVAPRFLDFMNRALEYYQDYEQVMQVSGYMFPGQYKVSTDGLFLPIISCWGWGTWRRAWIHYDVTASGFKKLQNDSGLRLKFNLDGAYNYYEMLEQQVAKKIDSWGVCWLLSVFLRDGVVLYPSQSLVCNIGVDGSGTHGQGLSSLQVELPSDGSSPLQYEFPEQPELNPDHLREVQGILHSLKVGFFKRLLRKLIA